MCVRSGVRARRASGVGIARAVEVREVLLSLIAVRRVVYPDSVAVPEPGTLPGLAAVVRAGCVPVLGGGCVNYIVTSEVEQRRPSRSVFRSRCAVGKKLRAQSLRRRRQGPGDRIMRPSGPFPDAHRSCLPFAGLPQNLWAEWRTGSPPSDSQRACGLPRSRGVAPLRRRCAGLRALTLAPRIRAL